MKKYASLKERFYAHVDIVADDPDACWEWTGAKDGRGYGMITIVDEHGNKKTVKAHRLVWELEANTKVPTGLCSCHKCDNPSCVRLNHLFIGTVQINNWDAKRKGRVPHGETKYNSKLTVEKVQVIRRLYREGSTIKTIAEAFKLNHGTVWAVIFGKNWRSVAGWEEETIRDKKKKKKLIEEIA